MKWLWTWGGSSFGYRDGDDLYTSAGTYVGQFVGDEVYAPNGHYLGEIMSDNRLIVNLGKQGWAQGAHTAKGNRGGIVDYVGYVGYVMYLGHEDFPSAESFDKGK